MRSRADIAFTRVRVAVFVDGCFWHGCPQHATLPKANRDWWRSKIVANRERDERISKALEAIGWRVIRAWEHEDPIAVAQTIIEAIGVADAFCEQRSMKMGLEPRVVPVTSCGTARQAFDGDPNRGEQQSPVRRHRG
jgi:DNA mismatch endonuclease (patch repair protein)